MQFDFYISTYINNESVPFSSIKSKFPIAVSSFTKVKPEGSDCFFQKVIDGYLIVVYEIKDAGFTLVRGNKRNYDENRYAISSEPVNGLLEVNSLSIICDYLKSIKKEDFNNLTKQDFEIKYSKIIEDKVVDKTSSKTSSNSNSIEINNSLSSGYKKVLLNKITYIYLFLIIFIMLSASILGASLFTKIKNIVRKSFDNLTPTTAVNKRVFATVKAKPKYYDDFISILKNRDLDYEKLFIESFYNPLYSFQKLDEDTIKYFTAYYFLNYMEKAYKEKNVNVDIPNDIFSIIKINNSPNVDNELEKGTEFIDKAKFDYSKFEKIYEIYDNEIRDGCDFETKFGSEKLYKIYLFLPSVKEMKSVKEINPQYFSIKGKKNCEKWEDFPEVFGYENEKEMIIKREKWFKHFIEEILRIIKEQK